MPIVTDSSRKALKWSAGGVAVFLAAILLAPRDSALGQIGYQVSAATVTATTAFRGADGSLATPSVSFTNDTDTGFYSTGDDCLGMTQGGEDLGQWCVATGTLTATQVRKLNATPIEVIGAPGSGEAIVLESAQFHLDFNTTAYDSVGAGEDIFLGFGQTYLRCDNSTCLDAGASSDRFGLTDNQAASTGRKLVDNDGIDITLLSGEWATTDDDSDGDSPLRYLIRYRIVSTDLS